MKQSAGILLFRKTTDTEFFLVHPGGPFFRKKHEGWWTIPKGELLPNEQPLEAAIREFKEETGYELSGPFKELNPVIQKGGKQVLCWAVEGNVDADAIKSNTFEIEWPPKTGKRQSFPEIDEAGWFGLEEASRLINERQSAFLHELIESIKKSTL